MKLKKEAETEAVASSQDKANHSNKAYLLQQEHMETSGTAFAVVLAEMQNCQIKTRHSHSWKLQV